tara:strand:- start:265 stop:567 length:303 start_codon:yes stop_codon:yes gene_type:complete
MVTPDFWIGIEQINIVKELINVDRALVDNGHVPVTIDQKTPWNGHGKPAIKQGTLKEIKIANGLGGCVVGVKREFQFGQSTLGCNWIFCISVQHVYAQSL